MTSEKSILSESPFKQQITGRTGKRFAGMKSTTTGKTGTRPPWGPMKFDHKCEGKWIKKFGVGFW